MKADFVVLDSSDMILYWTTARAMAAMNPRPGLYIRGRGGYAAWEGAGDPEPGTQAIVKDGVADSAK